ncbi:MAG: hypothetical protein COV99_03085 [Bacteroidetes bacterium CG12_big_fil_rev_8_21_14_0_65_60_17]|nr:MAG: hypothetical protein COV99_03085 [Bacteroidetes bacterium CG12_big_fil_rev_8_21_14_0_65_60_17]
MLRELYAATGPIGTLIIATLGFISAVGWLMAVAGISLRPWPRLLKAVVVLCISLLPPLSLFVLAHIHLADRKE